VKKLAASALVLAAFSPAAANAQLFPPQPGEGGWFVQTDFLGSFSSAPGSFAVLPPGATGDDQTSYQPQEYFGAGAGIGYQFSAWGVPFRAVLDGSLNFRHDTDVVPLPANVPGYKGNLQTIDIRLSLLADVLDFGWGRFYVGGGIGAARVRTEVELRNPPTSIVDVEWKASPSFEAGIIFTGFSSRVIPHVAYRFRWVGEVESGTFPTGERVRYSDFNIHDLMFGFTIPLQEYTPTTYVIVGPTPAAIQGESYWTGFHVGAFGGWALAQDFTATGLATSGDVPYNAANSYDLDTDGVFAGGEIGVDWQMGWVLLGLSGEGGLLDLEAEATDPASTGGDTVTSLSTDWYGGMSVRGGLAYDRFLAYGRIGAFFLNGEAKTIDDCTVAPCGASTASASDDDILFGWYLGGGLEYAFADHWSIGGEYRYYHPNDNLYPSGTSSSLGAVAQEIALDPFHAARASLNFRW
jgi:outer membrane immunogenic protein